VVGQLIRVHGDYHLGQVLRVRNDYAIRSFAGPPERSAVERRRKAPALTDLASMISSFGYAAHVGLMQYAKRHPDRLRSPLQYARAWERHMSDRFLRAYERSSPDAAFLPIEPEQRHLWLRGLLLQRALRELRHELAFRPDWAGIPLRALMQIWRGEQG
jgi:maltose alpha-D-glucosyltransferase/alpha-amylase